MMSPSLAYAKLLVDSTIRAYAHKKPWEDNSAELSDCLNLGRLMLNVAHSLAVAAEDPEAPEYLALYQKCQDLARPWVKRVLPTDGYEERNTLKLLLDLQYETQAGGHRLARRGAKAETRQTDQTDCAEKGGSMSCHFENVAQAQSQEPAVWTMQTVWLRAAARSHAMMKDCAILWRDTGDRWFLDRAIEHRNARNTERLLAAKAKEQAA